MENVKKFLANKKPGWYVSLASFVLGLITLIVYAARGGNHLSPVSTAAVLLLVFGVIPTAAGRGQTFRLVVFVPRM